MNNDLEKAGQTLRMAGWDGTEPALVILGAQQRIHCLKNGATSPTWPVSTGVAGFGNQQDSGRTPTGLHRVYARIGADAPPGMVFK